MSGPSPSERLAAADALVRAGCFDCLLAAFRDYEALRAVPTLAAAATTGATRTAALLAVRERDLGTEDSGYLRKANELAASTTPNDPTLSLMLQVADSLPTRGGARSVTDDTALARNQTALRNQAAWTEALRLHADEDPLAAYLWLSFNCAYVSSARQTLADWLAVVPAWRDTSLLKFKAAVCAGYTRASFENLLQAEPRFVELHYFIGASAAFSARIDDAIEHLLRAYQWRQRWPGVTYSLAADYVALEEFDKAIEFYDRTLEVLPTFPDALLEKGKTQTYAGRYTEAIATLDRLLALERWLVGDARYWRAVNENQLEQLDVAWDDVELAAKLMRNAAVPKLAGIIAYKRHQLDVARCEIRGVVETGPRRLRDRLLPGHRARRAEHLGPDGAGADRHDGMPREGGGKAEGGNRRHPGLHRPPRTPAASDSQARTGHRQGPPHDRDLVVQHRGLVLQSVAQGRSARVRRPRSRTTSSSANAPAICSRAFANPGDRLSVRSAPSAGRRSPRHSAR